LINYNLNLACIDKYYAHSSLLFTLKKWIISKRVDDPKRIPRSKSGIFDKGQRIPGFE